MSEVPRAVQEASTTEELAVTPRIVEAVFTSANTGHIAPGGGKSPLAKLIEMAMAKAVDDAYTQGITDPDLVRELMQKARADMKARFAKYMASVASNLAG